MLLNLVLTLLTVSTLPLDGFMLLLTNTYHKTVRNVYYKVLSDIKGYNV